MGTGTSAGYSSFCIYVLSKCVVESAPCITAQVADLSSASQLSQEPACTMGRHPSSDSEFGKLF